MKLHALFADHAVLPADKPLRIFGEGDAAVTVTFANHTAIAIPQDSRWFAELPPLPYGGPYELRVTDGTETIVLADIYVGEVYLFAGQSNMQFKLCESNVPLEQRGGDERLRFFTPIRIEAGEPFTSADGWVRCTRDTADKHSAIAYLAARALAMKKNCAIGVIACYQGASVIESWLPRGTYRALGIDLPNEQKHTDHTSPLFTAWNGEGVLYETALGQILPYPLTAAVWYQGESDTSPAEGAVYDRALAALFSQWRADFHDAALPIVIVQIADFEHPEDAEGWTAVQTAQVRAAEAIPHTALVVSRDVCEADDIHPPTKHLLAARITDALLQLV